MARVCATAVYSAAHGRVSLSPSLALAIAALTRVSRTGHAPPRSTRAALYGEQCATCHGADGRGLNGPNLTTLFAAGGTDDRVLQTIRNGVPGSIMPPSTRHRRRDPRDRRLLKVLATPPPSSAAYVRPNPNADRVTLTTNDGREIHGERKNEDAFSIQIARARRTAAGLLQVDR